MLSSKEGRDAAGALMQFGGLGVTLALGVALFTWLGSLVDRQWGTTPVGLAGGCLLGAALGLYKVIRDVTQWSAAEERREGSGNSTDDTA